MLTKTKQKVSQFKTNILLCTAHYQVSCLFPGEPCKINNEYKAACCSYNKGKISQRSMKRSQVFFSNERGHYSIERTTYFTVLNELHILQ
jgi:hypothetical protein